MPYEKIGDNEPVCIADEVPFEIPESWEWCRLGFANEIYTGNSINENVKKSKYTNLRSGYNYIATKDVDFNNNINYDNGVKIPFNEPNFRIAYKESILLCIEGGSAGRKIALTSEDVCFGNKLCCFKQYSINTKFLYYYLQSNFFKETFKDNTSGIIGGVSVNTVKSLLLPIPPFKEQERIVNEIEKYLPLIDKYDSLETELNKLNAEFPEKLKKSILQQAIQGKLVEQNSSDEPAIVLLEKIRKEKEKLIKEGKIKKDKNESIIYKRDNSYYEKLNGVEKCIDDEIPFEIPESWEWCRLGSILTKITDGTHKTPKYTQNGVPFLSVKDLSEGYINTNSCKYISKKEHDELFLRCNPEYGDILLTKVGTTGIPVINESEIEFSLFVSVALLKFDQSLIHNKYLKLLIESPLVQKQCRENTKGVGNKNWVIKDISNTLICIPSTSVQKRIVKDYNTIENRISKFNSFTN